MTNGTTICTPWESNGWLIALQGDHDLSTRRRLERETRHVWPLCKAAAAVIDLTDTTFIDSGVIRWLLRAESALEEAGAWTLSIVEGPPGSVAHRLFGLLRMRHVLACYPTRAEVLAQEPAAAFSLVGRSWTVQMRAREAKPRLAAA